MLADLLDAILARDSLKVGWGTAMETTVYGPEISLIVKR